MARPIRVEFSGDFYHITARGNTQQPVFLDDRDREKFLEILAETIERFKCRCHAYCLIGNHYHLVVETPEGNLSCGMRQLNGIYTQAFKRRHSRVGHVFQGRYRVYFVEKDSYLLNLCRYVVLNPVCAGMERYPGRWNWSSYRATAGEAEGPLFLSTDWVLSQFGRRKKAAVLRYREYVGEGDGQFTWENLKGQIFLGGDDFVDGFRDLLIDKKTQIELPEFQRYAVRPSLEELLGEGELPRGMERDQGIYHV